MLRLFFDSTGRIGRRAFVLGMAGLYAVGLAVPAAIAVAMKFDPPMDDGGAVKILLAIPIVALLQFVVLPYANVCLHLKRLRDAGRGPISLIAIAVFSLLAIVLCGVIGAMQVFGASRLSGAPMPTALAGIMIVAGVMIVAVWPFYGVWVALGRPEGEPAEDFRDLPRRLV